MRKATVALVVLAALAVAPSAGAHMRGAFTLRHAHIVAARYERTSLGGSVTACHWTGRRHRTAACAVNGGLMRIFTAMAPMRVTWTDIVTRNAVCVTARRTGPRSGVSHGVSDGRGCFTGSLVVIPVDLTLL